MSEAIPFGKRQIIDGRLRVYYYGYWVKAYDAPADTLLAKKRLIEALTRRLFNHVEHGINIPGTRLDEARRAFDGEGDPERKRVKGAMLAGAIFNRAADIFTKLVELQELGVTIDSDNALMHECGDHLMEALTLGKMVLHRSGEEGLDELWGEPFKAFSYPIEAFYNSRYIKIAQSMQAVDTISGEIAAAFADVPMFAGVDRLAFEFARAAKVKCETLRTDADIIDVWTSFVVSAERMAAFKPLSGVDLSVSDEQLASQGMHLLLASRDLIAHITRARIPMPKTTREFVERCQRFRSLYAPERARSVA